MPEPLLSTPVAGHQPQLVVWRLASNRVPHVLQTIRFAEALRAAVIRRNEELSGTARLHACLHRSPDADPREPPDFWLPLDLDFDGGIDHVALHARRGLCPSCSAVIMSVAEVMLDGFGALLLARLEDASLVESAVAGPSRLWVSATPFFGRWNPGVTGGGLPRAGRDAGAQLSREISTTVTSLPSFEFAALPATDGDLRAFLVGKRVDRTRTSLPHPVGGLFALAFAQPLQGPLSFGLHARFGLGRFRPAMGGSP